MIGKILILRWGDSAYDSLGGILELIAQQFAARGIDVVLFSADGAEWPKRLIDVLRAGGIKFALTMSGIGADMTVDGKLVWEVMKIPLFNWNCDHPCYFPSRHVIRNPFLLHGYVFPDHAHFNITHLKPNGAAFALHLGLPPRDFFPGAPLPLERRNGRLVFAKSGQDTNKIEATWRSFVPHVQQIVFSAAEELFHCSTADFLPVLQRIGAQHGLFLAGDNRLALLLLRELDSYIRFRRANLVVKTILQHPVDVFGTGWDHIDWDGARAAFHGAATWRALIDQLPHYVGCLSINPLIEDSIHDRTFFALSAGVVPISDSNRFSQTTIPDLEPYTFSMTRERIEQAIDAVLAAPEHALERTERAWRALKHPFGMRQTVQQLVQFVALHGSNVVIGG